ncbi:uncharacterized protein LOC129875800 [Solanum dulcamara]|uniref:uncharacterized protein LOC129875800 n=1 Tax=Solanum dulcamara TaxID=45834 RepID=UPI002485BB7E|nr:uncharacterized protein LOC129875800 [Solanum dulcamara]
MSSSSSSARAPANKDRKMQSAENLVLDLRNPNLRKNALIEFSKKRELFQDLAPLLWHSFGSISAFLQKKVSIYPVFSPPIPTPAQSNGVCNVLALLQVDDTEVISFLVSTEIIPHCLCTMEMGSELSKNSLWFPKAIFQLHPPLS